MVKRQKLTLRHTGPLDFFEKLGPKEKCPAYVVSGDWTIVSWNPTATFASSSIHCFKELRQFSASTLRGSEDPTLLFTRGILGYMSYDAGYLLHRLPLPKKHSGPLIEANRYKGAVLFRKGEIFLTGTLATPAKIREILRRKSRTDESAPLSFTLARTRTQYGRLFEAVQKDIRNGEYYQLNLTHQFRAATLSDHRRLFIDLERRNRAPSASYFEGQHRIILSLSPETFVSVAGEVLETSPIKGTRPRGATESEDRRYASELLKSEKEAAELNMITDLLRNDIGKLSMPGTVRVLRHRSLQKNLSVWHTYSTIVGKKLPELSSLDVLIDMFPGGSITGCPKRAAMKAISRVEKDPRGPYTGSFFLLSAGGNLASSILIRTIVAESTKLSLGVGGGIVADSVVEDEWKETKDKASPFLALAHGSTQYFSCDQPLTFDDPRITLFDPSSTQARGVFETLRIDKGAALHLSKHLSRLTESARLMKFTVPVSSSSIRAHLKKILKHTPKNAKLKIVCTRHDVLFSVSSLPISKHTGSGTITSLVRTKPKAKALPYYREWKAHENAKKRGFDEAILVDRDGNITEGAYSSIFWVQKGVLCTRLDGVLPGITQARVLAIARLLKIPIHIGKISRENFLKSLEVFMTKSTTGITPIIKIDRKKIGTGKVGPMTKRLIIALSQTRG